MLFDCYNMPIYHYHLLGDRIPNNKHRVTTNESQSYTRIIVIAISYDVHM